MQKPLEVTDDLTDNKIIEKIVPGCFQTYLTKRTKINRNTKRQTNVTKKGQKIVDKLKLNMIYNRYGTSTKNKLFRQYN